MKLTKSIELLEDFLKDRPSFFRQDWGDAIKLGIEALKYVREERKRFFHPTLNFLPGEDPE